MTIRILVLSLVAALCLIAASPKTRDVDGDGYGPQMVTEKAAPRAQGIATGTTTFATSTGTSIPTCVVGSTGATSSSFAPMCASTANGLVTIQSSGSGAMSFALPLPTSR